MNRVYIWTRCSDCGKVWRTNQTIELVTGEKVCEDCQEKRLKEKEKSNDNRTG